MIWSIWFWFGRCVSRQKWAQSLRAARSAFCVREILPSRVKVNIMASAIAWQQSKKRLETSYCYEMNAVPVRSRQRKSRRDFCVKRPREDDRAYATTGQAREVFSVDRSLEHIIQRVKECPISGCWHWQLFSLAVPPNIRVSAGCTKLLPECQVAIAMARYSHQLVITAAISPHKNVTALGDQTHTQTHTRHLTFSSSLISFFLKLIAAWCGKGAENEFCG